MLLKIVFWLGLLLTSTFFIFANEANATCKCRAQGRQFSEGDTTCINGRRMVCGKNQNVTSWNSLNQSCEISGLKLERVILAQIGSDHGFVKE